MTFDLTLSELRDVSRSASVGAGLTSEQLTALALYHKALEGDAGSQASLGRLLDDGRAGLVRDRTEAVRWYRRAAEQGELSAQIDLALMYLNGDGGLAEDRVQARFWLQRAIDQGDEDALATLTRIGS